jgi:RND family efflux transporter MFP subunit
MSTKRILSTIGLAALVAAFTFFAVSCQEDVPAETVTVNPDLSIPPPGSKATQEKWDSFDEAKKKEAWAVYMEENPDGTAGTSPAAAEVSAAPQTAEPAEPSSKSPMVSVVVGALTRAPITLYYYGLGELKAGQEQRVSPLVPGIVASLYIGEGDFVEEGDLLFSLDDSDLVREIELVNEKWNAELELAQIRLNEALSNYESSDSLYQRDLITKAENDSAKKAWEEARIAYEKVRLAKTTELEKLRENLRTNVVASPGRGYVSEITFTAGEQITSSDFVEVVDIENLSLSIRVPENIITRIQTGSEVLAKQASGPEYSLKGTVTGRGIISDINRSYEVTARLDNPDQRLLPGMLMEAQIRIAQMTSNFIIPRESLIQDGADKFIYLVKDNTARKIPVTTGQSRGGLLQVSGAFEEGDLLVLQGQSYLREGMGVKIIATKEYLPERREL